MIYRKGTKNGLTRWESLPFLTKYPYADTFSPYLQHVFRHLAMAIRRCTVIRYGTRNALIQFVHGSQFKNISFRHVKHILAPHFMNFSPTSSMFHNCMITLAKHSSSISCTLILRKYLKYNFLIQVSLFINLKKNISGAVFLDKSNYFFRSDTWSLARFPSLPPLRRPLPSSEETNPHWSRRRSANSSPTRSELDYSLV